MSDFWSANAAEWLSAVGTVGAVIIAVCGNAISRYRNRPIIASTYNHTSPYLELRDVESQCNSTDKEYRIRLKITNNGKGIAHPCTLSVDSYYRKRHGDDSFCKNNFLPAALLDSRNKTVTEIAPNMVYYVDVASIRKTDERISEDGNGRSKQFYKVTLLKDSGMIELGRGTFIIPIKILASNAKSSVTYLKIYWDSDGMTEDKNLFQVKIITAKEFNSLKMD